jgi:hypothetical protein
MIDSVPARAPLSPPETGTSTRRTRPSERSASRAASSRTARGELVEPIMSSSSVPAASSPSGPSSIEVSWGRSGSITRAASTCSASSRGVSAQVAPASSSSGFRVREWTTSAPRAASRWEAMGSPIEPRPITPTRAVGPGRAAGVRVEGVGAALGMPGAGAGEGVVEASSVRMPSAYGSPVDWTLFTPLNLLYARPGSDRPSRRRPTSHREARHRTTCHHMTVTVRAKELR